jgi:hypothetical protein
MNLYTIPRTQICSKVLGIFAEEEYEFRKFVCLNETQTAQDGDKLSEVEDDGVSMNFSEFGYRHEISVFSDFRANLVQLGNELETQN